MDLLAITQCAPSALCLSQARYRACMRRPLLLLACAGLLALNTAFAAGSEDVAARLQAATQAHEEGHLNAARQAFERLAREGVPAAHYNLAVMHLRGEMPHPSTTDALRL